VIIVVIFKSQEVFLDYLVILLTFYSFTTKWNELHKSCEDEFRDILKGSLFVDEVRQESLCSALRQRIEMLAEIVHSRTSDVWVDDRSSDVTQNIAYSGEQAEDDWEQEP